MWWKLQKVSYWEGISKTDERVKGIKITNQFELVRIQLKRQGITVTHLSYTCRLVRMQANIKSQDIAFFTRQLANLLQAGFPLAQAFDALIQQYPSISRMPNLLMHLKANIEDGMDMSTAFRNYPEYFNALYCNLVEASEHCGNLPHQLLQLADYQDQLLATKQKLQKALYYPMVLLSAAIIVLILLMLFLVPQFELLFKEVNASLPLLTRILIKFSNGLKSYLTLFLIITLMLGTIFRVFKKAFFKWLFSLDHLLLKLPWVSSILHKIALMRFCYTLSTTLAAKLPMGNALAATAEVVQYTKYKLAILEARYAIIESGIYLPQALENTCCFPAFVIQMIETGQNTSQLPEHLKRLAEFFDKQLNELIEITRSFFEPVLLVIIGLFVGSLLLAFYWPIFELGNMIELV